jgi:hypothetical protein
VDGTLTDGRPGSKTVLKGRLTPQDLAPFTGQDPATSEALFAQLQADGVLNAHGRITDILTLPDFALDAAGRFPAGVDKAAVRPVARVVVEAACDLNPMV